MHCCISILETESIKRQPKMICVYKPPACASSFLNMISYGRCKKKSQNLNITMTFIKISTKWPIRNTWDMWMRMRRVLHNLLQQSSAKRKHLGIQGAHGVYRSCPNFFSISCLSEITWNTYWTWPRKIQILDSLHFHHYPSDPCNRMYMGYEGYNS